MRRSRFYLLRRRLYWTGRFRNEFGWSVRYCWQTAGRNQRFALQQIQIERDQQIEAAWFEADVLDDIDHIDEMVLKGAI